jgi:hypothetical protein
VSPNAPAAAAFPRNVALALVCVSVALALSIFGARLLSVLELGNIASATGMEGTSVYAISQACRGIDVYGNLPGDPNVYMYNFLFYDVYGALAALFSDCGPQSTLVSRMASTIMVFASCFVVGDMARREGCGPLATAVLSVAPLGPLVGWWGFGVRPDVAALLATLLSLSLAQSAVRTGSTLAACASVAAVFAAYGFKQTYLLMVPVIIGYFLVCSTSTRLRWAVGLIAAVCTVLVVVKVSLDYSYFLHTVEFPANRRFHAPLLISNLLLFIVKAAPYLLLWGLALGFIVRNWRSHGPSRSAIYLTVSLFALLLISSVAAGFVGASDSYFFPVYAVVLTLVASQLPKFEVQSRDGAIALAAAALVLVCTPTLLGLRGSLGLEDTRAAMMEYRRIMASLPGSKLVISDLYALPAYTERADVRVFDYHVYLAGPATRTEWASISQMVAEGRFDVIAMSEGWGAFLDLTSYRAFASVADVRIYRLARDATDAPPPAS